MTQQHWFFKKDAEGFGWLTIDRQDASTNSLNQASLAELAAHLDHHGSELKGLVIKSGKSNGFIAGADIGQIAGFTTTAEAMEFVKDGQAVLQQLADLPYPTVAMIDGFCFGGGLELAMACRYRIAKESPETKLGLPEVLLGIHPAWGGTHRIFQLIDARQALRMMLTGSSISASRARKIGLVDVLVPARQFYRAAVYLLRHQPKPRELPWYLGLLLKKPLRQIITWQARRDLAYHANPEHYPAPYALLDLFENQLDEATSVEKLIASPTTKELMRVFFLREQLKSYAKGTDFKVKHVHIVGAGPMGAGIAAWCALQGIHVTLQDREAKFLAPAFKDAYQLFQKKLKEPRLIRQAMDHLIPDIAGCGIRQADLIIEAIYENLEAKQQLFKQLEQGAKPEAILATNTSSIPLDKINSIMKNPERLVGIHFFNPVSKMELIEVVCGDKTDPAVIAKASAFVGQIKRLALPVKSSPGFLVNRVLMPYLLAGLNEVEAGISPAAIDDALKHFGMFMGPIELADFVGLDICLAVAKNLGAQLPERLVTMVEKKQLGLKSGQGFYAYRDGKLVRPHHSANMADQTAIAERLIQAMVDEGKRCVAEGVVATNDLVDAGMIFGTGFAPFRGGPLNYSQT